MGIMEGAGRGIPEVVDFVSLDVEGSEPAVLRAFPFDRRCGKIWIIKHNNDHGRKSEILSIMGAQGCEVVVGQLADMVDLIFRCACGSIVRDPAASAASPPVELP